MFAYEIRPGGLERPGRWEHVGRQAWRVGERGGVGGERGESKERSGFRVGRARAWRTRCDRSTTRLPPTTIQQNNSKTEIRISSQFNATHRLRSAFNHLRPLEGGWLASHSLPARTSPSCVQKRFIAGGEERGNAPELAPEVGTLFIRRDLRRRRAVDY